MFGWQGREQLDVPKHPRGLWGLCEVEGSGYEGFLGQCHPVRQCPSALTPSHHPLCPEGSSSCLGFTGEPQGQAHACISLASVLLFQMGSWLLFLRWVGGSNAQWSFTDVLDCSCLARDPVEIYWGSRRQWPPWPLCPSGTHKQIQGRWGFFLGSWYFLWLLFLGLYCSLNVMLNVMAGVSCQADAI